MSAHSVDFKYPRRRVLRSILHKLSIAAFGLLADLEIVGQGNIPKAEPLLVVGNHFSFADPVAFVRLFSWPLEFVGGADMPHAPGAVKFIPALWGYYPLYRGTGSRGALKAAEKVLVRGGKLGIFPEGGSWAEVLRPARPGTAYLAARTGARLLPVGLVGLNDIFPLRLGKRAKIAFRIGKPFGPFSVTGRGRERRRQLDEIGHEIMRRVAELLPQEKRGVYSDDPAIRAAAKEFEAYPWEDRREGEVVGEVH
ncbi:MAG: 1-acyl-sn-glycerol-3-phosphate acyltransferase [Chloroflexi bacterium]|nr:1-acyl-sn-glycerol-3-phosphate acyltransferase [Chloroflexota bacterium]